MNGRHPPSSGDRTRLTGRLALFLCFQGVISAPAVRQKAAIAASAVGTRGAAAERVENAHKQTSPGHKTAEFPAPNQRSPDARFGGHFRPRKNRRTPCDGKVLLTMGRHSIPLTPIGTHDIPILAKLGSWGTHGLRGISVTGQGWAATVEAVEAKEFLRGNEWHSLSAGTPTGSGMRSSP